MAPARLSRVQRLCDAGLVERSHARGADLQEDDRHAVRDDVVQLMRDLGPLLEEDLALPCFMPGLREGELGAHLSEAATSHHAPGLVACRFLCDPAGRPTAGHMRGAAGLRELNWTGSV